MIILQLYQTLFRFRDGDTIDILVNALNDLRKTLRGIRAISFTGDSVNIIEYAAKLLGPGRYRYFSINFINI